MTAREAAPTLVKLAAAAASLALFLTAAPPARPAAPAPALSPLPGPEAHLPPLPAVSPRNANYTIEARLDPEAHTIEGTLVLDWRNTSATAFTAFPFHLYWNAFRNNLSSSARGEGLRTTRRPDRGFGYTHVRSVHLLGEEGEVDLTPSIRFLQPDDGNTDDRTLMEVTTPQAVPPGGGARFRVAWSSQVPYGDRGRAGWVHDFHFVAQWFPKIAGLWKGGFNAHQFHARPEFFSDFGVYDVRLTVPRDFVLGATGRLVGQTDGPEGTRVHHYMQEDVHDFAWTTSRRFREARGRFDDAGYPPVDIRLLVTPEHEHLAQRHIEATKIALRTYGTWTAPYPYPQITVVDTAWNSGAGGMEYPTLFTAGTFIWAPEVLRSPESVTIHEAGHQFIYGLVANNEFEEGWLDEGFNDYHEEKAKAWTLGPTGWGRRYFGLLDGRRGSRAGWPVVAPGVHIGRSGGDLEDLREHGQADVMARRGWEYRTGPSYSLNSYGKPALSLRTLEGLLGEETMVRVMRVYTRRFRFAHPTTDDFVAVVNEVTGKDWRWFFEQTWFSSDLLDYAVTAKSTPVRRARGFVDGGPGNPPAPASSPAPAPGEGPFDSEVLVERRGGVRMPVEVLVEFADGHQVREAWDGQYRWARFRYTRPARVARAVVDPEGKLALDVVPANNAWMADEPNVARRAAAKWAARWMFWLQHLLELHAVLG
ncbi:MAG TPA: M1 family metallopeptidase [Vicinamibacteria bacterium]|jgi:hypothetical protein